MKDGNCILKYCSALILAALLVTGALTLSGPHEGMGGSSLRAWSPQSGPTAGASGDSGELMVLGLSQSPGNILASLTKLGVEPGDLLDRDHLLVRVPAGQLAAAQRAAGYTLQPYAPSERLAQSLIRDEQSGTGSGMVAVDVTVFQPADKTAVVRLACSLGGAVLEGEAGSGSVVRLRLPGSGLSELSQLAGVVYVEPTTTYSLMNDRARDLVGATPLSVDGWLSPSQQGLTGAGQVIGLADSGLDTGSMDDMHPDLANVPGKTPKVVMLRSWAGAPAAADPNGHGTSMAATIAGTGAASSGRYQGLAPGASLYFQGLTNSSGQLEPPPDLQDLFAPAYAAGVRIHVDGWGGSTGGYQDTASQTDHFIREHPDFLAVFSAGNNGPKTGSLTPEAYSKNALVVGASQSPHPAFNSDQTASGQVCDFSSRGPTSDGRLKPDLLAPGAVISARASQVTSKFDLGGGYYTYMEGTSMAAAVAGGSAALLREYFTRFKDVLSPTAALLKAALICGASTPAAGPSSDGSTGFGTLDLGSTILSLQAKTFNFVDALNGVANGGKDTYTYQMQGTGAPFKAALVWTDPSVSPGTAHPLVNNLDLVVRDPSGKVWLGNSFLNSGKPDDANNVEEVYIPQPQVGVYTIYVQGTSIVENTVPGASGASQDYALVYGQPLIKDVVQSVSQTVTLASGSVVNLDDAQVNYEQDGHIVNWPTAGDGASGAQGLTQNQSAIENGSCGADIYLPPTASGNPAYAYLAGLTWQAQGVQLINLGEGFMLTEVNPADRSGGFLLAPGASSRLLANGSPLPNPGKLPPGVEVRAVVNPSTQTVWSAAIAYKEVDGFFDRFDQSQHELYLVGSKQPLTLAPDASLAYLDEIVDADPADLPFGAGSSPDWDKLLPGLKMELRLSPESSQVMYAGACRQLAVGTITSVDATAGKVTLSSGTTYRIEQGASVQLDEQAVGPTALAQGQHVIAMLDPDDQKILSLSAYSQVLYGQVVNVSAGQDSLDLIDDSKNFHDLQFSNTTQFFRWGLPAEVDAVEPGSWVRLYLDPKSGEVWRLDLAEAAPQTTGTFVSYDAAQQTLTTDGGSYRLTDHTLVTNNGYLVTPEDLVQGEIVSLAPLQTSEDGEPLLASVSAQSQSGVTAPTLEVAAPWRGDYVILAGITSAERLYLYLPGEPRQTVPVTPGEHFLYSFQLEAGSATSPAGEASGTGTATDQSGQKSVVAQLVAVDTSTGGASGQSVTIPPQTGASLNDLAGNWAAADVEALLAQGLISGYPDNTFRPDAPITRAEFVVMLAGALGWSGDNDPGDGVIGFSDAIPDWARQAVGHAEQHGLVHGYPDNTFRPDAPITRAEAAVILGQALRIFGYGDVGAGSAAPPPWTDWTEIPAWAQASATQLYNAGILEGRTSREFSPSDSLTRGEAAAAVYCLLKTFRQT